MFDKEDEGMGVVLWAVIGAVTVVLVGLLGGLMMRQMHHAKAAAKPVVATAAVAAATTAAVPAAADTLLDAPISGDLAGTLYFASGSATLPEGATAELTKVQAALLAAPGRKVVLSGFHDATGDPLKNAELAKERAKSVREALKATGVTADRIALRKPEITTGDGSTQEARRVEIRLVE